MKRIFLALEVELNDYTKLQSDFLDLIGGRWIPSENLHITVCYFGDRYSVDELLEQLPSLIIPVEPLRLESLGYFKSNKILYAGTNSLQLERLNSSISDYFSISHTKEFLPHATLMRIKEVKNQELFSKMLDCYKNTEIGKVDTVLQLMQSHIEHPGGAKYECIKRFEL